MTNRKCCGSCRFFEVGTVQGHGLCRNPDYEGRDESVLLRAEELACRTGWQKDSWQLSEDQRALEEAMSRQALPADQGGSLPIGQGFAPQFPGADDEATAKIAVAATKSASPAFPAGRRRNGQPGVLTTVVAPRAQPGAVATVTPTMQGHPELGENGEVIRRPNRTMVAEAHRKALERREAERESAMGRRQDRHSTAIATILASAKPTGEPEAAGSGGGGGTTPPRNRDIPVSPPASTSLPTSAGGAMPLSGSAVPMSASGAFGRAGAPLPEEDRTAKALPLPKEADDHPVAVGHQSSLTAPAGKPARDEATTVPSARPLGEDLAASSGLPMRRGAESVTTPPAAEQGATTNAPYWDAPGVNNRFLRMRQENPEPPPSVHEMTTLESPVPSGGRIRNEAPPPPEPAPVGRTIRSLSPRGGNAPFAPDDVPTITSSAPARIPRTPLPVAEARPTEPKLPVMPPRQIDPQLVKQLQQDWRERALAAHSGQRCGTCRFFQSTESAERGSCSCPLADSYRQAMGRQDLGCLNSFGTWWAADDSGWMQKTELSPRRPTPLLDQLLWEKGVPDAVPVVEERRRSAR